jgi:hypothetical protein
MFALSFGFSLLLAWPASAQYASKKSTSARPLGETYHVEFGGDFWNPTPDVTVRSESLGIPGDEISLVGDLGAAKTKFLQLKVVLRPATKHKFRFEYTPAKYEQTGTITRDIIFNGIRYPISLPVESSFSWNAYRFTYEYDFVYLERGFVGFLLEAKYTDVQTRLSNILDTEYAQARAPIPAIGVIGRGYVAKNVSITGEFSAFKLPDSINEKWHAKYYDFDLYGTFNFTNNVGAQVGYRSFDVNFKIDTDEAAMTLKGLYFGGVARF